ncbi:hypothetical protein Chor_010171, partial [Crotalus horridus]
MKYTYRDMMLERVESGDYTEDIAKFANSWAIQIPDDATCEAIASSFPSPCNIDTESYESIYFKCQILLQFPFLSCHQSIDPYPYISSCMNDLCRKDDDETYCRAVTEYARSCSHVGYPIRDWRDDFPACTDSCEDTFIHRDCISCCPPTCTFEKDCLGSNLHCLDGCYCPDAFVWVVFGTALNMIAQSIDYDCIQSLTLIFEDDLSKQVTLFRGGEIQYSSFSQGFTLNGYIEVQNMSSLFVQLKTTFGLKIQFAKDGKRVYIQLSAEWKSRTMGLCGTYNGNLRDDFLSPSGMIEGTPQLHANAWKISSACHIPVNIPVVDPCNINQQNAIVCRSGMLYHPCSSFCEHSCSSLSLLDACDNDCAEGCNCPEGKYFEESINFCVPIQCLNGTMKCNEAAAVPAVHSCPDGKIYYDCQSHVSGLPSGGVNCELTCTNIAMNFTCTPSPPCLSGCICPPGMAEHKGKCYVPDSCPCMWKDWEYISAYKDAMNEVLITYLETELATKGKSVDSSNLSLIVQNKKCFDNDIVCSKDMLLTIGDSEIFFSESLDIEGMLRRHGDKSKYQVWKAGYYVAIHFPEEELMVLWDRKTTMHIKVGARWKVEGKLAGLCGNFDKFTSNDLTTSNNMEVKNAQIFGESWAIGQIDVTSFVKNCHTDTCNCNLGGDCECLCTSIAAYAHKCCQQGVVIHWRSPSLCPYDCDYYNQELGKGPYILASYGQNDTVIGVNVSSKKIFPLFRNKLQENVYYNFMLTPGLYKDKILSSSLISLECAERPNYFLYVHNDNNIFLAQWDASLSFRRKTTFIHHQGLWISGYSAFELHSNRGFFLTLSTSAVKILKFVDSEEFKSSSSFSIKELHAAIPYRRMCEWRYEPCTSPCVKTCDDPEGTACKFLPPVEGCLPYCPKAMILDEVTLKCVYPEDCIPVKPSESSFGTKPVRTNPTMLSSQITNISETFSQMPLTLVIEETEPTYINLSTKITTEPTTAKDAYSATVSHSSTHLPDLLPASEFFPEDSYNQTTTPVLLRSLSPTTFPSTYEAPISYNKTPNFFSSSNPASTVVPSVTAFSLITKSTTPLEVAVPSSVVARTLPTSTILTVSQTSKSSETSSVSAESKHVLQTDSSPVPTDLISLPEFAGTRMSSSIPIKISQDEAQITDEPFDSYPESEITSTVKSVDTFATSSSETSLKMLTTRAFTPQISVTASHSESLSAVPTTSAVVPTSTDRNMPAILLNDHLSVTNSSLITNISTIHTMSFLTTFDESAVSLGTRRPSLTSSLDRRTLSSLTDAQSAEPAMESALTLGKLWNITSTPQDITEKYSVSSSENLVSSAGTIVLHKIAEVTEFSPISFDFHTTTTSIPVLSVSQAPIDVPNITVFTPKPCKDSLQTMPLEMDKVSDWVKTEITQASKFQNITSTLYALKGNKTPEENITMYARTEKSSLPSVQMTTGMSASQSSTASVKPVFLSEMTDITFDWSRIPSTKSYYSVTKPEEVSIISSQNFTITDLSQVTAKLVETQSTEAEVEMMTTKTDEHASFGTIIHTLVSVTSSECMPADFGTQNMSSYVNDSIFPPIMKKPRYLDPVDKCSQYVCINMEWMLYNLSKNCHKNVEKPDCGFRGMPVQTNSDSCCPEWECPCQCSILSELSIITFDGNNVALHKVASYILVKLPTEIIVAHIEKCPANQFQDSLSFLFKVPAGSASGLCFKKLNVTIPPYAVLINRLARKVIVNSIIQPLPFLREGICIQDTGAMYVINTPAGINIKWAHVTGIMDIQYGFNSNVSIKTEGLCGVCNGDPSDDLKMQNRTIITNMEEVEIFIKSWEIDKSFDVTTRRPVRNCTEDNCTYCMELLQKWVFAPCHKKVSPQHFCEKMWVNNTYFENYECDALSAYVALCNKHNICIKWRTPDYCWLACPYGKEYQPCVQPCDAKTCLNKWFYEKSSCSYLREDCVCKKGTILHRTDSDLCIPEEKCVCTDNGGHPHSVGEVWIGSNKGCCIYKCMENGSIIDTEPECDKQPSPMCDREAEVIVSVTEEQTCCPKNICECNMTLCSPIIPVCRSTEKLTVRYTPVSCCPQYQCECDMSACPNVTRPECREDQFIVEVKLDDTCCLSYLCVCESCIEPVPECNEEELLAVDLSTAQYCCPHYHCVCEENLCPSPLLNCSTDMKLIKKTVPGQCCPDWNC